MQKSAKEYMSKCSNNKFGKVCSASAETDSQSVPSVVIQYDEHLHEISPTEVDKQECK